MIKEKSLFDEESFPKTFLTEDEMYVPRVYPSTFMKKMKIGPKVFMDHKIMLDHSFGELVGEKLILITTTVEDDGTITELIFYLQSGKIYKMFHHQKCCENVYVEDITENLDLLLGKEILQAYETKNADGPPDEFAESYSWTFYTISTFDISITIRWFGSSNGCYSESVDFIRIA